ncbi:N-acetylmuramoyl-L-alanine amidase [Campylobacter sp. MIT 21-1685]|uniref:N-acetylmuramoyl-L-alanine amidase family protein n=1 Tax=unclassified Campylobacter TaxID=2593542 RepID=UPI00224A83CB|nr:MULTISPECIES: N-acetylmuramoyl-L-alanine amidase [unclassified Campylobacter]MCX2682468.1 N-acetylmuramoyl-L-alanine amidase [Campylobacter sp. MIT 21-1684]MCX2750819.1 N-acetylmuramoyl-L-alanine amidase [Campylobacter sp. MIT 21-1682]MCX2806949.1 N-acetylmuramoyl-L-alanine amidase [Campylobacter sp. MIT 21-1685]
MLKILAFILMLLQFCFSTYENELADFDKNFIHSQNQLELHNKLKSLYIQTVINEDEKTKIEVLKRLLLSSKSLNLDDSSYVQELQESGVSESSIKALRRIVLEDTSTKKSSSQEKKNVTTQQPTNSTEDIQKKQDTLTVLHSRQIASAVELQLNTILKKEDIKSFALEEKDNFRFIADFEAILQGGRKEYHFSHFRLVISQYNPKIVRIVVYAKEKIPVSFEFKKNVFKISVTQAKTQPNSKTKASKSIPVQNKKETTEQKRALYVLNVEKKTSLIELKLSDILDEKMISTISTKDSKFFRQIVSFEGVLEGGRKNFTFGQNAITITQYNPKIVRIVLSSSQEFKFMKKINGKNLIIGFESQKKQAATQTNKKSNTSKNVTKTQNTTPSTKNKLIVIDAGHGGKDSGALSDPKMNLKEKDIVLSAALKVGNELKKRGYRILYTRNNDKFINLRDRTKLANDKKADLFLSIHANAVTSTKAKSTEGLETFFLSPARSERSKMAAEKENQGDFEEMNYFSKQSILNFLNREKIVASNKLAIDIQRNILLQTRKRYKIVDGGVREAPFWVLVGAQMPAILVEIGYITHPNEAKRIASKTFQELLAKGIADGVQNYFYHNQ